VLWKSYRYSRWGYSHSNISFFRRILPLICLIIFLILGFQIGSRVPFNNLAISAVQVTKADILKVCNLLGLNKTDKKNLLREVLPVASFSPKYVEDEATDFLISALESVITADLKDPRSFFLSQIAYLGTAETVSAEPEFIPEIDDHSLLPDNEKSEGDPGVGEGKGPVVAIYCTHNAESYLPSQGVDRLEGKNGGVFLVASHLKKILESKHKISTIISSTIHDYPDWSKSYANSLVTVKKIKENYPSVKMFIDIHRDANVSHQSTTTKIQGENIARIMFIVGSNKRLPHPNWQENYKFAKQVAAFMNQMYPGLLKGVRVQDGRYNQHVSPYAILAEIGATKNTLDEAKQAVEMLADVINKVLN
jgi:stage II sporulation protein P